ncbi:hypothetical protein [Actinomadura terrae]|uniref:hypothetical protein n=1 Tax=Actinomadura terrae TaxID=604353 RepID=UPI001FA77C61|nr:hypothetical protein [Actinomadura terrae]
MEGATWLIEGIEAWIDDPDKRELLLWGLRRTEREPTLLGASRHLLAVARAVASCTSAHPSRKADHAQ